MAQLFTHDWFIPVNECVFMAQLSTHDWFIPVNECVFMAQLSTHDWFIPVNECVFMGYLMNVFLWHSYLPMTGLFRLSKECVYDWQLVIWHSYLPMTGLFWLMNVFLCMHLSARGWFILVNECVFMAWAVIYPLLVYSG